jgi:hypothetical protein
MESTAPLYNYPSIAEAIMQQDLPKWKKYLLRKLLPAKLWESRPEQLVSLPAGTLFQVRIDMEPINTDAEIDLRLTGDDDNFITKN